MTDNTKKFTLETILNMTEQDIKTLPAWDVVRIFKDLDIPFSESCTGEYPMYENLVYRICEAAGVNPFDDAVFEKYDRIFAISRYFVCGPVEYMWQHYGKLEVPVKHPKCENCVHRNADRTKRYLSGNLKKLLSDVTIAQMPECMNFTLKPWDVLMEGKDCPKFEKRTKT